MRRLPTVRRLLIPVLGSLVLVAHGGLATNAGAKTTATTTFVRVGDKTPPALTNLRVDNGGTPFAGDKPLLTTFSPNGDGFRDRATVRFRLNEPATVTFRVARTSNVCALSASPVTLCGSLVPQPNTSLSTEEK